MRFNDLWEYLYYVFMLHEPMRTGRCYYIKHKHTIEVNMKLNHWIHQIGLSLVSDEEYSLLAEISM